MSVDEAIDAGGGRLKAGVAWGIFLLPILIHFALLLLGAMITESVFELTGLDLFVYGLTLVYLIIGGWVMAKPCRRPKFLLLAYSTFASLFVLEYALRATLDAEVVLPMVPGRTILTPKKGLMAGIEGRVQFTVNSLGLRGRETEPESNDINILAVGGSTTECLYVTDEQSWPWVLETQLSKSLDKKVFVANAGKSGHFTLHHDYLIRHYRHIRQFDYVLLMVGINDMFKMLHRNYRRSVERAPKQVFEGAHVPPHIATSDLYYRRSYMAYLLTRPKDEEIDDENIVQDESGAWIADLRKAREKMLKTQRLVKPYQRLSKLLKVYRVNLKQLIQTCRDQGVEPVFMTQPTIYRSPLPREIHHMLWLFHGNAYSVEALEVMMRAYNDTLTNVCKDEKVVCIDMATKIEKDLGSFYDDCHFNPSGCQRVANVLEDYFVNRLKRPD